MNTAMTGHICIIFTMTILGVHIFHLYSSNSSTSNHTVFTGVNNFCLQSVQHVRAPVRSRQPQSTDVCLLVQTSFNICVCGAVYAFSRIFSPFSLSEHYYIGQYRRKKYVFMPSQLPTALLLICAFAVANLSACNTCSRYFSLHFSCNCIV